MCPARWSGFLIGRGERVVRVSTRLMAGTRRSSRDRGKSDQIDAMSVARAALAAGIETLPTAALAGPELDLRLLVDHRERLVRTRVALNNTLQWNLHDLWPELAAARRRAVLEEVDDEDRAAGWRAPSRRCASASPATSCATCANSPPTIKALEAEITELVDALAPQLVAEPGCGPLTAAKLVGEIAGADRFASDAKLASAAGIAPIPASSGRTDRHRLDRGGNRQINAAIHRMAVTRARCDAETPELHHAQEDRRQDPTRRHPLPQAPPRPPHLAAAARAPPSQKRRPLTIILDIGAAQASVPGGRFQTLAGRRKAQWAVARATFSSAWLAVVGRLMRF